MRRRIICEDDPWTELFWKFTKFNRFRGYFRDSFSIFFFFCFCCIGFGIYSIDARNGRARGMRRSRDRIVSRVIQGRISRKFIRTFRNVRNFNFIRWTRQVFSINLPIWWFQVEHRRDNRKGARDFRVEASIHQSSLLIRSRGRSGLDRVIQDFEWQVFSRYK